MALFITCINVLTMRVVRNRAGSDITSSVAILIPMRDEETNAGAVLDSATGQRGLPLLSIIALDDNSSDDTLAILQNQSDVRLTVVTGSDLPAGWLGKPYACQQLAQATESEFLVFLDADVRLEHHAVNAAITAMEKWRWDFISPYPREIAVSFSERLIQPLLQWSWMSSVFLRLAERFPSRSTTIANGQFFIVKRSAYLASGGHDAIREKVLDDLELARSLVKAGFRGGVADGSSVAECRMYDRTSDLIQGYTKSLWTAFGGILGTIVAVLLLALTGIVPLALALTGNRVAWAAFGAIWISRLLVAARTRSTPSTAALHPISICFLLYLIALSWIGKARGDLTWRGRAVLSDG
jgi:glycosyltransferase involved in cell wall biosynthesis